MAAPNDETPSPGRAKGLQNQTTHAVIVAPAQSHDKPKNTLIAKLAIAAHAVHELADGGFLVCRHCHTYHAPDFAALQAFAKRLGVS